jgi:hypothetical protein
VERGDGQRGLLHIELQTKADADIGERLAEYAIRLWRRDHLPVHSVVIFLRPVRAVPQSPFVVDLMGQEALRYVFDVLRLWEIPAESVLDTPYVDLWPLSSLMAHTTVASILATAERIAATHVSPQERSDLAGLLVLLAGLRFPPDLILDALRRNPMIEDLVKQSSVAGVLIDEGMRKSVRLAMQGGFGPLDEDVLAAIQRADKATLENVLIHIATDTLEQVRARLGLS